MAKRSVRIARLIFHLPRAPARGVTVRELRDRLLDDQIATKANTIYRDLCDIAEALGGEIERVEPSAANQPHRWRLSDASDLSFPGQSPQFAVAIGVLERDGERLLPASILEELKPLFLKASRVLSMLKNADPVATLPDRIRLNRPSVRRAIERTPPSVQHEVRLAVLEGIAERRQLQLTYRSRSADKVIEVRVDPIGLDSTIYQDTLVCNIEVPPDGLPEKYSRPYVQLVLHRVEKAVVRASSVRHEVRGLTMDGYFVSGEHDLPRGGASETAGRTIELEARIEPWVAKELTESPLAESQRLEETSDGSFRLVVHLPQSDNLMWWCLSMIPDLIVTAPNDFRERIATAVATAYAAYDSSARK